MAVGRGYRLAGAALLATAPAVQAQEAAAPAVQNDTPQDIVITGERLRGSVIGDAAPVAVLDAQALKALGATRIDDILKLLKPLTTSNSGADPVFLLNGRRISGYGELRTLPPEAIERTEILPEPESARFGYPPTVRVTNFITKKHFRSLAVEEGAGTTTDGGASTAALELGSTRLDDARRTSVTINYDRQDPLSGARRSTVPDASNLFDLTGNVTGIGGGAIDPALNALAGRAVTAAAVPGDPAARGTLAGYAAGVPRVTDLAPYQSLASRDQLRVDGTQSVPIGKTVTGSLNLTMEAQRGVGLAGLPTAVLRVPASNPASPFATDVLLYRYLPEAGTLRQRTQALSLHAGSTVQGSLKRWIWTVTGSYDRARTTAAVDRGIATDAIQAAIDAGADPFQPLGANAVVDRLVSRSRTVVQTLVGKATVVGPLLALPAGDAQMTLTGDFARSSSGGVATDTPAALLDLRRVTKSGSVALDLPIASASRGVLDAIGSLSANASLGVSAVSDYGSVASRNLGLIWTPVAPLQVSVSTNVSQTAPDIALLTNPVVIVPNAPFFDFVTGTSGLVAVTAGGNPALGPERRQVDTAGLAWQPIKGKELRFNLDYIATRIDGQIGYLQAVTVALQSAFPDRFVRDAAGQLTSVDVRPVNLARERERKIQGKMSLWTMIGPEPKPPATPPAKDAPPPPPPKPRPSLYAFVTMTARIDDRLLAQPGQPTLDLLDGQSISGNGGRPRYEAQGSFGGSYGPVQGGIFGMWQAPTRIRSTIAASDLRFSARTFLALYSTIDAEKLTKASWAKSLSFQLQVNNILNDRIAVRDRNGVTPYRFQPAFLDPYGRIVKLSVRKLF
jgi:hypothetical protein